jgi:hypothetical protein
LLDRAQTWHVRAGDTSTDVELTDGSLGLTVCGTPVVVESTAGEPYVEVVFADGRTVRRTGDRLDPATSVEIFGRTGRVMCVRAGVRTSAPRNGPGTP